MWLFLAETMTLPELFFGGGNASLVGGDSPTVAFVQAFRSIETETKFTCSPSTLFLVVLFVYLAVAMISNLISLYKFIVAWNLIMDQQRIDLPEFYKRRRRMTYKDVLKLQLVPKSIAAISCCIICLSDFDEKEIVTSCSDGCKNWFHKECLFEWLDRSDNCPCCRREMLSRTTRGFFADLSACMGFAPRAR